MGNSSNIATAVSLSGDAAISNTGVLTIAANAITTGKINDLAVTNGKLAGDAVNSSKIADGSIVNADVNASAGIALSKLADGTNIVTSLGTPSGSNSNGGSISSNVLTLSLANTSNSGLVSPGTRRLVEQRPLRMPLLPPLLQIPLMV
ncbi:MAG: hypothetical protein WDN67_02765 [Candidatus Moraniibacteriota bacterium]